MAPTDNQLFPGLKNLLGDKKFPSGDECENELGLLASRDRGFYSKGIMKLPLKLREVERKVNQRMQNMLNEDFNSVLNN